MLFSALLSLSQYSSRLSACGITPLIPTMAIGRSMKRRPGEKRPGSAGASAAGAVRRFFDANTG